MQVQITEATVRREPIPEQFRKPGGPTERDRIKIVMEAVKGEDESGKSLVGSRVWFHGGFSLHPKAPLRKVAVACMARDPKDDDELYEWFDTDKLVGRQIIVIGEYPTGSDYLKPTMFKRVAKAKYVEYEAKAAEESADDGGDDEGDDLDI